MERLRALREVYECLLDEIIVKRQGPRSSGFYENPQRTLAPETVFDVTLAPVDPAHILAAANAALAVEQVIAIEKQRALVAMAESSDGLEGPPMFSEKGNTKAIRLA